AGVHRRLRPAARRGGGVRRAAAGRGRAGGAHPVPRPDPRVLQHRGRARQPAGGQPGDRPVPAREADLRMAVPDYPGPTMSPDQPAPARRRWVRRARIGSLVAATVAVSVLVSVLAVQGRDEPGDAPGAADSERTGLATTL